MQKDLTSVRRTCTLCLIWGADCIPEENLIVRLFFFFCLNECSATDWNYGPIDCLVQIHLSCLKILIAWLQKKFCIVEKTVACPDSPKSGADGIGMVVGMRWI